jgi:hypothetical protein
MGLDLIDYPPTRRTRTTQPPTSRSQQVSCLHPIVGSANDLPKHLYVVRGTVRTRCALAQSRKRSRMVRNKPGGSRP